MRAYDQRNIAAISVHQSRTLVRRPVTRPTISAMAAQTQAAPRTTDNGAATTVRTVIVIDRDLPKGLAANAAAVLAHGFC